VLIANRAALQTVAVAGADGQRSLDLGDGLGPSVVMIDSHAGRRLRPQEKTESSEDLGLAARTFVHAANGQKETGPPADWHIREQRQATEVRLIGHLRAAPQAGETGARGRKPAEHVSNERRRVRWASQ